MVTRKDAAEVEIDPVQQTAIKSQPKLVVALGRGKTGKSTFIRWAAERAFRAGRTSVIADADRTNATLAAFFDNVSRPPSPEPDDVKEWLNSVLEQQIEDRFSLFLDLGGGDLILKEHARDLELADLCGRFGIDPVAVHFLGGDLDDLAYLRDIERSNVFTPERTVVVLNEGILPPGRPPARAFAAIQAHEVYRDVVARGARIVVMPRLACMAEVDRRRLMFEDAEASRVKPGQDRIGPINRQMIAIWLRQMNTAFADVADWLP